MKKKIENTPGPWMVSARFKDEAGNEHLDVGAGPEGRNILRIAAVRAPAGSAECEANARLIAAAPALLEALERLLYAPGPQRRSGGPTTIIDEAYFRSARVQAHNALRLTKTAEELQKMDQWRLEVETRMKRPETIS